MPDFLLDTNILSYWYDVNCRQNSKVVAHANVVRQPDAATGYVSRLFISVVTLGEIEYGHRVAVVPDKTKQGDYLKFVHSQCPVALEISEHVVQQYGDIRAWLFKNCAPLTKKSRAKRAEELVHPTTGKELGIDENDIWITAQAMTHGLVFVTHDSRGNFGRVLQQFSSILTVEDWAA